MSTNEPTPAPAPKALRNVGEKTRTIVLPMAHPDTDEMARQSAAARGEKSNVDVLLVNPPSPDGAIWIRTQHRVGRRRRENMIWPQVSLAQMAAMLQPDYSVEVIDAIAERMTWTEFEAIAPRGAAALLRHPGHRADAAPTTCTAPSWPRASAP